MGVGVDDVTVDLLAGEFTAVMGRSGSGKSTLMHCAAGLDDATSGHVYLGDVDLTFYLASDLFNALGGV